MFNIHPIKIENMKNRLVNMFAVILLGSTSACIDQPEIEAVSVNKILSIREQLPVISHVLTLEDQNTLP